MPNLLLAFPNFEPASLKAWMESVGGFEQERDTLSPELGGARAQELADKRRAALAEWQIGEQELAAYCAGTAVRVLTPLLSVLAERRLMAGQTAELGASWGDAAALNSLLAAPSFASWRQGVTLDIGEWLTPSREQPGKTPIVIVSVAHLDDEERALVLGVLLEEVLSWVRTQPGSQRLRALRVFDEVYGFLPPHRPTLPIPHQAPLSGANEAGQSLRRRRRGRGTGTWPQHYRDGTLGPR